MLIFYKTAAILVMVFIALLVIFAINTMTDVEMECIRMLQTAPTITINGEQTISCGGKIYNQYDIDFIRGRAE